LLGGPVGLPARLAATSNIEGGSGTKEGAQGALAREGGMYLDKVFAGAPELLVTPLLMEQVCLVSQGRFEQPAHPCSLSQDRTALILMITFFLIQHVLHKIQEYKTNKNYITSNK